MPHRQSKHRMFRKISCRFFPECHDEEECLYEHITEPVPTGCPNGQQCSDQECSFSEKEHKSLSNVFCRFKTQCNRTGCQYKHSSARQAFLGESLAGIRRR